MGFFYRNQTDKQKRGIIIVDLSEGIYHEYNGIGFGNLLLLQRNNKMSLQKNLERNIKLVEKMKISPNIELHDAVLQWPKSFVLWLINYTKDINSIDTLMRTPLHYAAEVGRSDIVELLLSKGATPNFKDINGNTPLHLAVEGPSYNYCEPSFAMNQEDCIKILLKYGGDPNIKNDLGQTPKDIALQFPEKNYLAFLLSPSNEQLSSLNLLDAIRKNNFKLAEALINSSIDVNQKDKNGESPLEAAWFMGKKFIDLLVENGADVNQYFRDGLTPLQHAVIQEDEELVRLLLDKGAVLNKKAKNGYTALDFANIQKTNKTKDIIRILEEHGE